MTAPATGGAYLARRRVAAGLSVADVATMLAISPANEPAIATLVISIEADRTEASGQIVNLLRGAFAFDPYVYRLLAGGMTPPMLCRVCACSWCDACDDELTGPCAWTPGQPDLCTHCAAAAAAHLSTLPERMTHAA